MRDTERGMWGRFERDVQDMLLVALSGGTMTWVAPNEDYATRVYVEVQRRLARLHQCDGTQTDG